MLPHIAFSIAFFQKISELAEFGVKCAQNLGNILENPKNNTLQGRSTALRKFQSHLCILGKFVISTGTIVKKSFSLFEHVSFLSWNAKTKLQKCHKSISFDTCSLLSIISELSLNYLDSLHMDTRFSKKDLHKTWWH